MILRICNPQQLDCIRYLSVGIYFHPRIILLLFLLHPVLFPFGSVHRNLITQCMMLTWWIYVWFEQTWVPNLTVILVKRLEDFLWGWDSPRHQWYWLRWGVCWFPVPFPGNGTKKSSCSLVSIACSATDVGMPSLRRFNLVTRWCLCRKTTQKHSSDDGR